MKLIERYAGDMEKDGRYSEPEPIPETVERLLRDGKIMTSGMAELLSDPRRRFVLCAELFSFRLGSGTISGWPLPLL